MAKFNLGDKVKIIRDTNRDGTNREEQYHIDEWAYVIGFSNDYYNNKLISLSTGKTLYCNDIEIELIEKYKNEGLCGQNITQNNNNNNMTLLEKIKFNLTGEPLRTLIENKIRTQNGDLTSEGIELFQYFLEQKHKDEFDKFAIAEIEKNKEEKK